VTDPTPDPLAALTEELAELERTDPAVAKAAANYDATVKRLICPECRGRGRVHRVSTYGGKSVSVPCPKCGYGRPHD